MLGLALGRGHGRYATRVPQHEGGRRPIPLGKALGGRWDAVPFRPARGPRRPRSSHHLPPRKAPSRRPALCFVFRARSRAVASSAASAARRWSPCRSPVRLHGHRHRPPRVQVRAGRRLRRGRASRYARYSWSRSRPQPFSMSRGSPALDTLYPGAAPIALPLTLQNPNSIPIVVTELRVAVAADPTGCDSATNLELVRRTRRAPTRSRSRPDGSAAVPSTGVCGPDDPASQPALESGRLPSDAVPAHLLRIGARVRRPASEDRPAARSRRAMTCSAAGARSPTSRRPAKALPGRRQQPDQTGDLNPRRRRRRVGDPDLGRGDPAEAGTVTYYVTRDGEPVAGTCPTTTAADERHHLHRQRSRSGHPLLHGHRRLAHVDRGKRAQAATVTVGAAAGLSRSPPSTTTPVAGAGDNLTITAQDASATPSPPTTGSKSLTFSGASGEPRRQRADGHQLPRDRRSRSARRPRSTSSPAWRPPRAPKRRDAPLQERGGEHQSRRRRDLTAAPLTVTVAVRHAAETRPDGLDRDSRRRRRVTLTITAQDIYGNTATAYTGSKNLTFSGALASPAGNAPTVTNASNTAIPFGTATADHLRLRRAARGR